LPGDGGSRHCDTPPSEPEHQRCVAHQVTGAAITDGLIFMAITMVLVRTLSLASRSSRLPSAPAASPVAA